MESDESLFLQELVPDKGAAEALSAIKSPISDLETSNLDLSPFNVKNATVKTEIF